MPAFWASASRILKPGGTVALWATCSLYCHPSDPRATQVQQVLEHIEQEDLGPFEAPGNRICRGFYDNLLLPWQCDPPITDFSKDMFVRKEWDRGGLSEGSAEFFAGARNVPLEVLGRRLSSASMVIRWREAHPHLANTKHDVVQTALRRLKEVLGRDEIDIGAGFVLLLFRKA